MIHRQGLDDFSEVEKCVLEPNGNFYVEAIRPSSEDAQRAELLEMVRSLSNEVRELKGLVAARG